jgi:hypothetical protein
VQRTSSGGLAAVAVQRTRSTRLGTDTAGWWSRSRRSQESRLSVSASVEERELSGGVSVTVERRVLSGEQPCDTGARRVVDVGRRIRPQSLVPFTVLRSW